MGDEGSTGVTVAVVGVGAIGGYIGSLAADARHDLTLCVRSPMPGLRVRRGGDDRDIPATILTEPTQGEQVDWLLLATKEQDTAATAPWLERLAGPDTTVVVLQNGLDHRSRVQPLAPRSSILPALVYITIEPIARGHVRHSVGNRIVVEAGEDADRFAAMIGPSGVEVDSDDDFATAAWRKLLGNIVANPLTALTMRRSEVLRDPALTDLAEQLLDEAIAVGVAEGANLDEGDRDALLKALASVPGENGTSMLFDRMAGKPLEHEAITGHVVAAGRRAGVPTPANEVVLALLRGLDGAVTQGR